MHENHLALSTPENLLSGALFSGVSTSSGGHCGQTCGRMKTLPWICGFCRDPRERLDCSLDKGGSQVSFVFSALIFCAAVDKEIRQGAGNSIFHAVSHIRVVSKHGSEGERTLAFRSVFFCAKDERDLHCLVSRCVTPHHSAPMYTEGMSTPPTPRRAVRTPSQGRAHVRVGE